MKTRFLSTGLLIVMTTTATPHALPNEVVERAKSLELDTPYVPPPGDPLAHHAAGYAKVMCSAVFISGLSPEFAAENVGFFTAPYEVRGMFRKPVIDRRNKAVHVTLPDGLTRTAKYLGSQGCVTLQIGRATSISRPWSLKADCPIPRPRLGQWATYCRKTRCRLRSIPPNSPRPSKPLSTQEKD